MLLSLILTAALTAQTPPPVPTAPVGGQATSVVVPTAAQATALADVGDLEAALEAFQRIAAANPDDRNARLWIARLHVQLDHPDRAEPVYRSVLLEDPTSVEAMIGVGQTLIARGEFGEAIEVLTEAEQREPQNPEILARLGRAHADAGHSTVSVGYFERAASVSPSMENLLSLERARAAYLDRVESTSLAEQFSGDVADTWGTDLAVNVRMSDRLRIFGRGQVQRKFNIQDKRAGGGAEWRWKPATTFTAHAMVGPDDRVLAQTEIYAAADHVYMTTRWTLGYRYLDFFGARASVVAPSVTWWADDRMTFDLRWSIMSSEFLETSGEISQSVNLRGSYQYRPRIAIIAGVARGVENFDALSTDRLSGFRANTVSVGGRLDLHTLTSILVSFDQQWRDDSSSMRRLTVSLTQPF